MTERGEINAALLSLDTLYDKALRAHRGVLRVEQESTRWWICSHSHEHVTTAYDCAHAAREQVREGILTHRLTGSDEPSEEGGYAGAPAHY